MAHGRPLSSEPTFSVRTVHLRLTLAPPAAARNAWPVRVRRCVFQGDFTQVHVTWGDRELVVRSAAMAPIADGQDAFLTVDPACCVLLVEG